MTLIKVKLLEIVALFTLFGAEFLIKKRTKEIARLLLNK